LDWKTLYKIMYNAKTILNHCSTTIGKVLILVKTIFTNFKPFKVVIAVIFIQY